MTYVSIVPVRLAAVIVVVVAACGGGGAATTTFAASTTVPVATTEVPTTATTVAPATATSASPTTATSASPTTEEVRFAAGSFELVGNLVLPGGDGPFPAVIVVAGSGTQTRTSTPGYQLVKTRFTQAGFAVFSWDKPGSGDSTGELGDEIVDRASILAEGVAFLAKRPEISADDIGLWGLSQAGWVMPYALDLTDGIAFMIVVSGGSEPGFAQGVYQTAQRMVCAGDATQEDAAAIKRLGAQAWMAETYVELREALEALMAYPALQAYINFEVPPEDEWEPQPYSASGFFDPMNVVGRTTIPILAVFGELDRAIDPIQGAAAYGAAFDEAGNTASHVELIPGVGHLMQEQATGCPGDPEGATSERYLELLDEWIAMLAG